MLLKSFLYCQPLRASQKNRELIHNFIIRREESCEILYQQTGQICGLNQYLKRAAWEDDEANKVRIYLIKSLFDKDIVAYFGLKAGLISDNLFERDETTEKEALKYGLKAVPNTISGIEFSHFAVNDVFKEKHGVSHLGQILYPAFIYPIIKKASSLIGAEIVYLYAADSTDAKPEEEAEKELVEYYSKSFGFYPVDIEQGMKPIAPYYDNKCYFMYQRIN